MWIRRCTQTEQATRFETAGYGMVGYSRTKKKVGRNFVLCGFWKIKTLPCSVTESIRSSHTHTQKYNDFGIDHRATASSSDFFWFYAYNA